MSQTEKALRKSIEAMIKARDAMKKTAAEIAAEQERLRKIGITPLPK